MKRMEGTIDEFQMITVANEACDLNGVSQVVKMTTRKNDMVNHPNHYQTNSGLEAITVIESFTDELTGPACYLTGSVLKYMLRWRKKNGLEDLKKAQWYLNRLIDQVEKNKETDYENN